MPAEPETTDNDGDTWVEAKAILDQSTGEMRSYFWSRKTQKRVWDKPPPNAGKVVWWEQIAEYDADQTPQELKIVNSAGGEEKKKNLTPPKRRDVSPKGGNRGRSKTPPKSHDKKRTPPPSKSVPAPRPRSKSPKGGHHHHGPTKSAPPPKTTKPSSSSGEKDSHEAKPKERKEKIASLFVMAPQGSLNMGQVAGAIEQEIESPSSGAAGRSTPRRSPRGGGGGVDLRMSLPPPDGGDYDYEIEENHDTKDKFKAKPSTTVKSGGIKLKTKTRGDGDLWVEAQVLLNEKTGKTRSYFYSKNTQKRVWDEPPSGAGKVIYLKDVKRVYMRNKEHYWRKDESGAEKKNHAEAKAFKTAGKRQKPVQPKRVSKE